MIVYNDMRDLAPADVAPMTKSDATESRGLALTSWQLARRSSPAGLPLIVTVPDFLHYARLINTGQATSILRLPQSAIATFGGGIAAGSYLLPRISKMRKQNFWVGGQTLVTYDIGLIRSSTDATVMLHQNLTDFALFFNRHDVLRTFLCKVRKRRMAAGFHTQQPARLVSLLTQHQLVPDAVAMPLSATAEASAVRWKNALEQINNKSVGFMVETTEPYSGLNTNGSGGGFRWDAVIENLRA